MISIGGGGENTPRGWITTPPDRALDQVGTYGRPWPIVYGTASVKGVPLWVVDQGEFDVQLDGASDAAKTRCSEVQYAFSAGPVVAIDWIVYNSRRYGSGAIDLKYLTPGRLVPPSTVVFDNPPELFIGDGSTTAWSHLSAQPPSYRIPWPSMALMRCRYLGVPGGAGTVPEVVGVLRGKFATHANDKRKLTGESWTRMDALPGDVIRDLIENTTYGLGLPSGTVVTAVGQDGTAASSYDRYCAQSGWYIALAIDSDASVADVVDQICKATNSIGFWSGGNFKVIPLGDAAVGTYTPYATATALGDDDILLVGDEPITTKRSSWADTYNVIPVKYQADTAMRTSEDAVVESLDVANASALGVRRGDAVSLPCIRSSRHATEISGILARRSCYNRTSFEFTLSPRYGAYLEPGDLVSLSHTAMGLSGQLARINEIEETDSGDYRVSAVEWVMGTAVTVVTTPQEPEGYGNEQTVPWDSWAAIDGLLSDGILSPPEKPAFVAATGTLYRDIKDMYAWFINHQPPGYYMTPVSPTPDVTFATFLGTVGFDYRWFTIETGGWWSSGDQATQRGLLNAWLASSTTIPDPSTFRKDMDGWITGAQDWKRNRDTAVASAAGIVKFLTGASSVGGSPSSSTFLRGDGRWEVAATSGITSVTASSPLTSSGGTTPDISIAVGNWSGSVCAGDDARLSNARPASGGSADYATSTGSAGSATTAGSISGYNNPSTGADANTIAYRDGSAQLTAADFISTSDERLKENIATLSGALAKLLAMRAVSFTRKGDPTGREFFGLIAQEVQPILPQLVLGDGEGILSVAYMQIIGLLIAAVQELQAQIDTLKGG